MRARNAILMVLLWIAAGCGDRGEQSNDNLNDNLNNNHAQQSCGNGRVEGTEECDEGEANSDTLPDACRSDCTDARCGDGVVDEGETCDDGLQNSDTEPNACRRDCAEPECGDGVIDTDHDELCDDGVANSDSLPDACRTACVPAGCGDDVIDSGEVCDDGNTVAGDGCSVHCDSDETCGNGIVDTSKGEACDDGLDNSDAPDTPACRTNCTPRRCGDGIVDAGQGEQCDDGGSAVGDGCDASCQIEPRWSCQGSPSQCECDAHFHGADCDLCIVHVDPNPAITTRDGTSWATALGTLQEGIDQAHAKAYPCEVWVVQGTYVIYAGLMTNTLTLRSDVAVYGGFAGTESMRSERRWQDNATILDGGASVQVLHVVTASSVQNATLDGFTVRNGHAQGYGADGRGGGMAITSSAVTVRNCLFTANRASGGFPPTWDPAQGGAMVTSGSQVTIANTRFVQNRAQMNWIDDFQNTVDEADARGGAVANLASTVTVIDSTFLENQAQTDTAIFDAFLVPAKSRASGGALYSSESSVTIDHCHFESNRVIASCQCTLTTSHYACGEAAGGAVDHQGGDLSVTDTWIHENTVDYMANMCRNPGPPQWFGYGSLYGGGVRSSALSCEVVNTLVTTNRMSSMSDLLIGAPLEYEVVGAGLELETACTLLHDTLMWNDIMNPPYGTIIRWGGLALWADITGGVGTTVTNSIVWNGPQGLGGAIPQVTYSDVEAWVPGTGNIQDFPWLDSLTFRPEANSPCLDVADDSAATTFDRDGNPRFDVPSVGTSVADMGAYEYQGP